MKKPINYTALDFLHKFQEFKAMTPDQTEWAAEKLKHNPPRYYRFLELKAFMKAFDIGANLEKDFLQLAFLEKRNPTYFTQLNQAIQAYANQKDYEKKEFAKQDNKIKPFQMRLVVQHLLQFSEAMRKVLRFNSGVIEAGSITFRFVIHQTQSVLNAIDRSKLEEIEMLICSIIDPKHQSFSRAEIIEQFGFPDVDLRSIDMDWI